MKVNSLLTAALCLSSHFSYTDFPWCSGAARDHTSLTLSEAQKHQFFFNVLFHTENKLRRQWQRNIVLQFPSNRPARNMDGTSQIKGHKLQRTPEHGANPHLLHLSQQLVANFTKMSQNYSSATFFSFGILLSSKRTE